jgi:hypothetical protein
MGHSLDELGTDYFRGEENTAAQRPLTLPSHGFEYMVSGTCKD